MLYRLTLSSKSLGILLLTLCTVSISPGTPSRAIYQERPAAPTETIIDSNITTDTTWTLANSPYRVTAEIDVEPGVTLTIEPGVTVWIEKDLKIHVRAGASIIAKGTPEHPITFDRYRDPVTGLAPRWKKIHFHENSSSYFRYVDFAYGGASSDESTILHFEGPGTHVLNMCTVRDSKRQGITAQGNSLNLTVAGTLFEDNGRWSLAFDSGANVIVTGSTFDVADHIAVRLRDKGEGPATITISDSNFLSDGSNFVVYNEMHDSVSINARNNWWGQASGPYPGAVTAGVDYTPWRTTEAPRVGITTPPTAIFTVTPDPTVVQPPGTEYTFDASDCSDVEDYTSSLEVCWDWNNDGTCDTAWTTTKTATHSFTPNVTVQTVRLVVRDTDGLTSEATQDIALNTPPTATFTVSPDPDTPLREGTVYTFDASASSDAEEPAASLEVCWDWDNNGNCDTAYSTTKIATHTFAYDDGEVQTVRLVVRDTYGLTGEATRDVHVLQDLPPTATFTFTQPAWNQVNFDASASTDDHDPPATLQVAWDYQGDGDLDTEYSLLKTASYTYPHLGCYWPTLYVKDTFDRVGALPRPVNIIPPTAAISLTGSGGTLNSIDGIVQVAVYTDTVGGDVISNGLVITYTPWLTLPHDIMTGTFVYQGFTLSAWSLADGQPINEISGTYTITVSYDYDYLAHVLHLPFEEELELYHWASGTPALWTPVDFTLDTATDRLVAAASSFGDFALVMDVHRFYLPRVARSN
ncbi:MAG: hypothetical protein DRI80_04585 [Chloroflexota bacterium]|nr:MAG: hypothetical protein DRI80_04585 [Chloroflexota bacterium]